MRNKFTKVSLFLCSIFVVFINYKHFNASTKYSYLMFEYNRGEYRIPLSMFDEFDNDFPNITSTTLPIKFLKAIYLKEKDSIETALELLKESKKANPYLMAADAQIAKIFYDQKKYDSAFYYGSKVFYTNPNNNFHRSLFYLINEKRNDTVELKKAYNISKKYSINNTLDYVVKMNRMGADKSQLIDLLDDLSLKYKSPSDQREIKLVQTLLKVGGLAIEISVEISEFANQKFNEKNYLLAANLYEKALEYDPNDYVFIENAALSFYLAKDYENAEKYFKMVINDFDINDGKSEFYYGVMLSTLNRLDEACTFLKRASDLNYSAQGSKTVYNQLCN